MVAYYNEFDPYAAQWLRNLIAAGVIAPGDVDERSIVDVQPDDLRGYTQCHFFAGVGVWSYALRRAGWSDDRPVWTGSCPCPPFSAAGKGQQCPDCGSKRNLCHPRRTGHFICLACGCDRFADSRHLWPEFSRLIRERRPPVVFGEQVASADGRLWLDAVSADLRLASYGFAGADLCAAGVGAPHIRQRLFFVAAEGVAHAESGGWRVGRDAPQPGRRRYADGREFFDGLADTRCRGNERLRGPGEAPGAPGSPEGEAQQQQRSGLALGPGGTPGRVDDALGARLEGHAGDGDGATGRSLAPRSASPTGGLGGVDQPDRLGRERREEPASRLFGDRPDAGRPQGEHGAFRADEAGAPGGRRGLADADGGLAGDRDLQSGGEHGQQPEDGRTGDRDRGAGPTNGFWADADWLFCRDGRWRPVEPGTFPLAHGASARVGRLRAYGNAIVSEQAEHFITTYLEHEAEDLRRAAVLGARGVSAADLIETLVG